LHVNGLSSLLSSINFFLTIILFNSHSFNKLSIFCIGNLLIAFLLIISLPILAGALTLILLDRNFNTCFFSVQGNYQVLLFQHLFWAFQAPEACIFIIPNFFYPEIFSIVKIRYYILIIVSTMVLFSFLCFIMEDLSKETFVCEGHPILFLLSPFEL
tara:strand:+ start:548 stop:1018 length:471 start_codon:yes stop_codon:yes gene_type:complete